MKSPVPKEHATRGNENEEVASTKKIRKKKGRDGNFAAGLALMHGFTAANVGASRLTVSMHITVNTTGDETHTYISSSHRQVFSTRAKHPGEAS